MRFGFLGVLFLGTLGVLGAQATPGDQFTALMKALKQKNPEAAGKYLDQQTVQALEEALREVLNLEVQQLGPEETQAQRKLLTRKGLDFLTGFLTLRPHLIQTPLPDLSRMKILKVDPETPDRRPRWIWVQLKPGRNFSFRYHWEQGTWKLDLGATVPQLAHWTRLWASLGWIPLSGL